MLWRLVGGPEAEMLLNLASRVTDTDSWEVMLMKILNRIRSQSDQAKQDRRKWDITISYRGRLESTEVATLRDRAKNQEKWEYVVKHWQQQHREHQGDI